MNSLNVTFVGLDFKFVKKWLPRELHTSIVLMATHCLMSSSYTFKHRSLNVANQLDFKYGLHVRLNTNFAK